jgi:hypothetical protein
MTAAFSAGRTRYTKSQYRQPDDLDFAASPELITTEADSGRWGRQTSGLAIGPELVGASLAIHNGAPAEALVVTEQLHAALKDLVQSGSALEGGEAILSRDVPVQIMPDRLTPAVGEQLQ